MTFWELTRVLVRRWPIVLAGILCTVGCGVYFVSDAGVYFTRTNIVFQAPTTALQPNSLRTQSESLIETAGIVAKQVSGPGRVTKYATPDVTLVGLGVRDGWSLRLPDTGGQWATNFATQMLTLDVVGPTPEVVQQRQADIVKRVQDRLSALQRAARVSPANDITTITAPQTSLIYHVGGSRSRVLVMTALLGLICTLAVVLVIENRRWWRPRSS